MILSNLTDPEQDSRYAACCYARKSRCAPLLYFLPNPNPNPNPNPDPNPDLEVLARTLGVALFAPYWPSLLEWEREAVREMKEGSHKVNARATVDEKESAGYFTFHESNEGRSVNEAGQHIQATHATDRDTVANIGTVQPCLDLVYYIERAIQTSSLVLVVPWVTDLLAMQRKALTRHSTSYKRALELLRSVYHSPSFEPSHPDFTACKMVVLAQVCYHKIGIIRLVS